LNTRKTAALQGMPTLLQSFMWTVLFTMLVFMLPIPCAIRAAQEEKIYTVSEVNVKPQPIKGMMDFHNRWSKRVVYPPGAVRDKVQGMVFVEFIVNKDGTISAAAIKSGIGHGCDEAALQGFVEVCKEPWRAAIKSEEPVTVKMVIPFAFRIIER
jgi:protein TonB